jgi:hypothetical protein
MNYIISTWIAKFQPHLTFFDEKITFISDEIIDDWINYGMLLTIINHEQKEKMRS